jgi:S-adenosylmethionine-dependent methyltransferase
VQTTRGREHVAPLRQRLVSRLLSDVVRSVSASGTSPEVLDCGGGSGSSAVPLAQQGARVTVVDVSADALATLRRRAVEAGVDDRVRPVQGDIEALGDLVPVAGFDLVLAHGVLEAVDRPEVAFAGVAAAVRPSGQVSVLVSNPVAGVLSRAIAGDVGAALLELRTLVESPSDSLGIETLRALCDELGLLVEQVHGVGVFAELVAGTDAAERTHPGDSAADTLAELEELAAGISPYREIASRIHLLARRPGG